MPATSRAIATTNGATFLMSYIVQVVFVPVLRVAITEESGKLLAEIRDALLRIERRLDGGAGG